jgi:hypothetical protein
MRRFLTIGLVFRRPPLACSLGRIRVLRQDPASERLWAPEDIALGREHTFYVDSLVDGRVFTGDLLTGEDRVIFPVPGPRGEGLVSG